MATQNVNLGVNVSDNGTTQKLVKNVEQLHSALKQTQRAAEAISIGGTAGSRAAAAGARPAGQMSGEQYGSLRGSAGITGASARDFANQAQGLGGLVRLYATYAANVFAVSAAFTALKNAMDTTNMVRGLDQLGAATGRNLGALSKRLVELTDGAISFRDSMDAVAKTSSAGMTSRDIERLAVVAKNASLALGVAMPDAINRLSRGITKLEPELLDELGIFTKIDPAVAAYSRQVGKAASQLTDFERRQAFANAVLAEGEAKFGELATAAVNPYDKLLSSLKNVSQQALEVVNKVLAPVVNLLAASPGALAGAIAVLGTLLVRQALPALTEFKAGLASAAETATELAQRKASDAKAARAKIDAQILAEVETRAAKEIDAVDAAERKIEQLKKAGYSKNSTAAKLLAQDLDDIRKEDLAKQERIAKRLETRASKLMADPTADPKAVESARKAAEANREVVTSITAAQKAQQAYFDTEKKIVAEREQAAKSFSVYGLTIQAATRAQEAATKKGIISNAAYNASLVGVSNAFRLMSAEIAASGLALTAWEMRMLKAKAGLAMFVGVMGTLGAAVNRALGALGLIVSVVGILDSVFSNGSKEMSNFSSSLDKLDDAAANAARTLEHLDKRGGYATSTIAGISAMANALTELAGSAEDAVKAANKAKAAMGAWDTIKDNFFSLFFGGGVDKNLAKALAKDVDSALSILTRSGLDEQAREKFTAILGIDSLDTKSVEAAILKLSDSAKNNLVAALNESNTQLNNTNSRLQSFKSATEATTKTYQDFIVSTANSNPLFKVGTTLQNLAKTMQDVSTGGIREIEAAMIDLAESPQKGILFGGKFTQQLVDLRQGFLDQSAAVTAYKNRLAELDKQIAESDAKVAKFREGTRTRERSLELQQGQQLRRDREVVQRTFDLLPRDKIQSARDIFVSGMDNAFKEGSKLIATALGQSAEKAALTLAKARLGGLIGEERAREENRIAQQEIKLQMQAIDTNIGLILSQERLRASIDESNAIANLEAARKEGRPTEVISRLQSAATAATAFRTLLGQGGVPNLQGDVAKKAGLTGGRWTDMQAVALLQQQALQTTTQIAPQLAARRELGAQQGAQSIIGERNIREGRLQDLQQEQQYTQALLKQQQDSLKLTESIAGIENRQAILAQNKLDVDQLNIRQKQELEAIDTKIANAGPSQTKTNLELNRLTLIQTQETEKRNLELQKSQQLLKLELDQINRNYDITKSTGELENILAKNSLDIRGETLRLADSVLNLSKEYVISQEAVIASDRARLETNYAIQQAETALAQKREETQAKLIALRGTDYAAAQALQDELTRQEAITENTVTGLKSQLATRLQIVEATKNANLGQERLNQLLQETNNLADSLKGAFGDVGAKLGAVATSLAELAVNSEKRAAAEKQIANEIVRAKDAGDAKAQAAAEKALGAQLRKNTKEELNDNLKLVASTKNLFKEKTGAYKAIDKIERAMHAYKMAITLKETAMELWAVGKSVIASGTKIASKVVEAGVDGVAAVVKAIASVPFPLNIAAGAATAAAVGALLSQIGGKSPGGVSGGFVPTAEQRQETQGTGMTWDAQGNKIETDMGIFGDSTAKLDSINKGIQTIKDNSIEGLFYDNRMLKALERIAQSITGAAQSIYATPGIRTGLNFGTMPGTSTSISGLQQFATELGNALTFGFGGDIVGGIIGKIFGGGTTSTRSIQDAGILLTGTFQQIADGVTTSVLQYKDVLTQFQKDGGWFGSDRSWSTLTTETEVLRQEVRDAFSDVFKDSKNVFKSIADIAGIASSTVDDAFSTLKVNIPISLKGLSGEAVVKELNAVISGQLNIVAKSLFSSFEEFRQFGESLTDTAIRVATGSNKVIVALEAMGLATAKLQGNFKITETIITKMAGGIDNFTEQATYFLENFLTEAERVAATRKGLELELTALGVSTSISREEFKKLVQSLDLSTDSGRRMYQGLLDIAPEFLKVTETIESLKSESANLSIELLKAQNKTEEAEKAIRDMATKGMTAAELAIYDYNRQLEKQIESAKTLSDSAKSLKSNLDSVTKTIKSQIQSLRDYQTSLTLGEKSTLTATQQYAAAKSELDSIVTTINKAVNTPEEVETRAQAISKLSQATDRWLTLSRELFASGTQYTVDFNTVTGIINSVSNTLETQLSDAEKQLDALVTANTFLQSIDNSSKTTAQLISDYLAAGGKPLTTASFAVGTSYVPRDMVAQIHEGERIIPAVDNFKLTTSVANTDAYTRELLREIRTLNTKVSSLEQTVAEGAIINAEATNKNTEKISQTISDSSDRSIQVTRLQSKASIK